MALEPKLLTVFVCLRCIKRTPFQGTHISIKYSDYSIQKDSRLTSMAKTAEYYSNISFIMTWKKAV